MIKRKYANMRIDDYNIDFEDVENTITYSLSAKNLENNLNKREEELCDKISDLEAKLAERTEQLKIALKDFNDIQQENDKLAQQLADKDELLKQKIGDMKSTDFIRMCVDCGFMVQAKENDNQTAIRELEKVKKFLLEKIAEKQSYFDSGNYSDFADGVKTICELMLISIDNQIKSLKGESK